MHWGIVPAATAAHGNMPRTMKEIEFKFDIPRERLAALEKEVRTASATRTHLLARYFDTADGDLAAHRIALRLRKEGRHWVQTLKAMGEAGPLARLEHNVTLDAAAARAPVADPARHHGTPAGERLDKVLAHARRPLLVETFCTDIWRIARRTRVGGATIELALDTGEVYAPQGASGARQSSAVCELELELLHGPFEGLLAAAQRWRARHGLWLSSLTKAERGERVCALQRGESLPLAVRASLPRFGDAAELGTIDGAALQRAVLACTLAQVLPNASEVAAGNEDAEVIHQLRIGIRRTRTALRELDALAPGVLRTAQWNEPLAEAFRALGAGRDPMIAGQLLAPALQADGAPRVAELSGAPATRPAQAVRADAFQAALVDMLGHCGAAEAAALPPAASACATAAPGELIGRRLKKLHRQLVRDGRKFESLPAPAQHRVRKRAKRLRYLAEFVAPLFGERKVQRYLRRLQAAQDVLGDFQDTHVAQALYTREAARDPHAWYAVGWLAAQLPGQARASHKALGRLSDARRFWSGTQKSRP